MMRVLLLICALVACALGHGVMTIPTPLNTNPTTQNPCGVANLPQAPVASATWAIGQTVTAGWHLIAGDGGTTVTGVFDPTGTEVFTTANAQLVTGFDGLATPSLGFYNQTFTVPNVDCSAAPGKVCLFRMASNTGWNSCTYVNVTNCPECPPPPPPTPKCTQVADNTLSFCFGTQDLNKQVYILPTDSATDIQANLKQVFYANLNNTNVFLNGNDTACRQAYLTFLCALDLPPCPGSNDPIAVGSACKTMCQTAMDECQLNPKHEALYDCTALPDCQTVGSSASAIVASGAVVASAVAAMLF